MRALPRLLPMGDRALVVEFGDRIDPRLSARIAAAAAQLLASPPPGVYDIVPAYTTLTLHYDPSAVGAGDTAYAVLAAKIESWLGAQAESSPAPGRLIEIPVCYGGRFGEDIEDVAQAHGLAVDEAIALHSSVTYHVHMLGFVPGFAYLGELDPRLATPRRPTPRARVPAGTVAIGGDQTGIYSLDTPGGWQLIGRTPLRLFTPQSEPPCLLAAGDRVRFLPITPGEFDAMTGSDTLSAGGR